MEISGYRSDGVATAVALVNAVTVDDLADPDLIGVLADRGFRTAESTGFVTMALRHWAHTLRPVFEAATLPDAVRQVNALLASVPMAPHISDHGRGLHIHYHAPEAALVERVRAVTSMGLASLVCEFGLNRTGVCADPDCARVFSDVSRNARRRYCSTACANRTNVTAFRARRRARAAG